MTQKRYILFARFFQDQYRIVGMSDNKKILRPAFKALIVDFGRLLCADNDRLDFDKWYAYIFSNETK